MEIADEEAALQGRTRSVSFDDPDFEKAIRPDGRDHSSDPWHIDEEAVMDSYDRALDAFTAEQDALAAAEFVNALAPEAIDQSKIDAFDRDRAREGRSEFPPAMIESRRQEGERWASLLREDS